MIKKKYIINKKIKCLNILESQISSYQNKHEQITNIISKIIKSL